MVSPTSSPLTWLVIAVLAVVWWTNVRPATDTTTLYCTPEFGDERLRVTITPGGVRIQPIGG